MKLYYYIVDNKGNFITRKGINADFSLTDNYNFAYSYDDENDANQIISYLKRHPDFKNNKFKVITNKQLHSHIVSDTPLKSSKMKLKKGSKQAKDYMAYIRSLKKTTKPKKVGAIKIIEKGESKFSKPSATYQYTRSKKGTFKGMKKIGATKSSSKHYDTKSHNVNIKMGSISKTISGMQKKFVAIYQNKSEIVHMDIFNASSLQEARKYAQTHKKNTPELRRYKSIKTTVKLKK
jgi:hypothetical protein